MPRRALLFCLLVLLVPTTAGATGPTAQASRSCDISGKERDLGATYVTTLSAKGTSCGKAEGVVRAYHDCRGSGRKCGRKVGGYKCSQTTIASSPLQYDARVSCKKGSSRVKHTYTQNI